MVGGLGLSADEQLALQVIVEGTGRFMSDMNRIDRRIEGTTGGWMGMSGIVSGALATAFGIALVKAIDAAAEAMKRLVAAGLNYTKDAIDDALDFELAITKLDIAARDANVTMEDLEGASFALGKDINIVGVDAYEAAEGLRTLYLAGIDTDTIFGEGGLESTLDGVSRTTGAFKSSADLAAASTLDLDRAANLAVVTVTTFGEEAQNFASDAEFLDYAFNLIVQVADSTTAEISDFEGALKNVGPTASGLGYPISEISKAIGILSDRGIRGAEAGTALRRMLANLNRDTAKVREANEALGVSLFDSEGKLRSLEDVMMDYSAALNTDPNSVVASTIYVKDATAEQTRQYQEAIDVLDSMNEKIADHNAGLKIVSDTTLEKYIAQQGNANRVIAEYNELGVIAKEVTNQLTEEERANYVQTLAGVYGQNAFNALIGDGTNQFAALSEEMATATNLGDRVTAMAETGRGEWERLTSVLDTVKIQYGSLFLDALKDGIIILREWLVANDEWIQNGLERLGEVIGELAEWALPKFLEFLEKLPEYVDTAKEVWNNLTNALQTGGNWIEKNLLPILDKFGEWFDIIKPLIAGVADTEINARMLPAFESVKQVLGDDVMPLFERIADFWDENLPKAAEHFGKIWESFIKPALETLGKFVATVLIPVIGKLVKIIGTWLIGSLEGWAKIYFERIAPLVEDLFEWLGENLVPAIQDLVEWLAENLIPALEDFANWINEEGLPALFEFYDTVVVKVIEAISDLVAWIKDDLIPAVQDFATWLTEEAIPALTDFWEMLSDKISTAIETVTNWIEEHLVPIFESLTSTVNEDVIPAVDSLHKWIDEFIVPIFEKLSELVTEVSDVVKLLAESAIDAYIIPAFERFQELINEKIVPALTDVWHWVEEKVGAALEWLEENVLPPVTNAFAGAHAVLFDKLIPSLKDAWHWIEEKVGAALQWLDTEVVQPAIETLQKLWAKFNDDILPVLKEVKDAIETGVGYFLNWFIDEVVTKANEVLRGLEKVLTDVKNGLQFVIDKLRSFKESFAGFTVPEILQGHSPPPLYYSLKYIEGAMDDISNKAAPRFTKAMKALPAPAFAMGTTFNSNVIQNNQQYNLETNTLVSASDLALEFQEMQVARR